MTRVAAALLVVGTIGWAALLSELPWFRRAPLARRLAAYTPSAPGRRVGHDGARSAAQVLVPLVTDLAERLSSAAGITAPLALRLQRAGRSTDVERFRLQQLLHVLVGGVAGIGLGALVGFGPAATALAALAAAAAGALAGEHRLSEQVAGRRRRLHRELPVIDEQLGILLAAGWSVTAALDRLARQGRGVAAQDLREVGLRVRAGATEVEALDEWARVADLDAVRRLVAVLSMHRQATDLGPLIATEARAVREEVHRELLESIERRAQLVWVPVTVATLVPGLLLLAVPFVSALSGVTGG